MSSMNGVPMMALVPLDRWLLSTSVGGFLSLGSPILGVKTCCNQKEFVKYENHKSAIRKIFAFQNISHYNTALFLHICDRLHRGGFGFIILSCYILLLALKNIIVIFKGFWRELQQPGINHFYQSTFKLEQGILRIFFNPVRINRRLCLFLRHDFVNSSALKWRISSI